MVWLMAQICPMIVVKSNMAKFATNLALQFVTPILVVELSLPFRLVLRIFWFSKKTWLGIEGLELGIDR